MWRYAIYWLPNNQSELHKNASDWFNQTGQFQAILEEIKSNLSYYDFSPALKIPQKYGFHSELLTPFVVKSQIRESDIFDICQQISQEISKCDLKMSLIIQEKTILLKSNHQSNPVIELKKQLYESFYKIIDCDSDTNYYQTEEFYIVLSNTHNRLLHNNLSMIAELYWQPLLKNPIEITNFNLCFQKTKNSPFYTLMRFDF